MVIKLLIFFVALILLGILLSRIGIRIEKIGFNNGECIMCGEKYRYFGMDSQGSRGYRCDHCGHIEWVSYYCVDNKFRGKHHV